MPRTGFTPRQHGFHFPNNFVNHVATLPSGKKIETSGRCGGMAYASLDYFFADVPVPPYTRADFPDNDGVPPDGNWLADFIYRRLMDSYCNASAARYVLWTLRKDQPTWLGLRKGVTNCTKDEEIPRLRAAIDGGTPVVLGLIGAHDIKDVGNRNHQVVAYGYDFDPATEAFSVYIYDNNSPDEEVVLTTGSGNPNVKASNMSEPWRGFFVHHYSPVKPPVQPAP
jgi:hypothetical protein